MLTSDTHNTLYKQRMLKKNNWVVIIDDVGLCFFRKYYLVWLFEYFIFNTFNMLTKQKLDTGLLRTYLVFQ